MTARHRIPTQHGSDAIDHTGRGPVSAGDTGGDPAVVVGAGAPNGGRRGCTSGLVYTTYFGGEPLAQADGAAFADRYRYRGRAADAETGLQYTRLGCYDRANGRWAAIDPKRLGAGDADLSPGTATPEQDQAH
jgi:RHS repeat-associated protein